ncbi:MAG: hypothetical protein J4G05_12440 [Chlorobi bacterium]|nr:hypothetical protein [Chlorobiota bacterium]
MNLRTPLNDIRNRLNTLFRTWDRKTKAKNCHELSEVAKATERVDAMIRDLLVFSRIGRTRTVVRPTDLYQVIEETLHYSKNRLSG